MAITCCFGLLEKQKWHPAYVGTLRTSVSCIFSALHLSMLHLSVLHLFLLHISSSDLFCSGNSQHIKYFQQLLIFFSIFCILQHFIAYFLHCIFYALHLLSLRLSLLYVSLLHLALLHISLLHIYYLVICSVLIWQWLAYIKYFQQFQGFLHFYGPKNQFLKS